MAKPLLAIPAIWILDGIVGTGSIIGLLHHRSIYGVHITILNYRKAEP